MLAVLRMLPYVVLGFSMGALADAIDRKTLLIASLLVMAVVSGGAAFCKSTISIRSSSWTFLPFSY